jgi:urease accessory protein
MSMKRLIRDGLALSGVLAMAFMGHVGSAEAHVLAPYSMSFTAGFLHPLTGIDHLMALLAIGLWAGTRDDSRIVAYAAVIAGALVAGFASGVFGLALPFVEPMLLTSVLMLGLLAALATSVPRLAGMAVIVGFAFLHGHAHGAEAMGGSMTGFLAGFLITSLCLTTAGYLIGRLETRPGLGFVPRLASGAIAASGLALLVLG